MERLKEADHFLTGDPTKAVKIFKSDASKALTVPQIFDEIFKKFPRHTALKYQKNENKIWHKMTYKDYKNQIEKVAKCFIKFGLKAHECVAILAFNCPEWFITELAAIYAGGIAVGIYCTNSPEACQYILKASKAKIIVVDDLEQMEKILSIKDNCPHLQHIIKIHNELLEVKTDDFYWWSELVKMDIEDVQLEYEKRRKNIFANQCCLISFTSGTTGNPKGVMLSHDNLTWNPRKIINELSQFKAGEEVLVSFLPLSHIAAQFSDIFLAIALGATVYFADKNAFKGSLLQTLKDARPTIFLAVPRVYEKFHEKISPNLEELRGISKSLMKLSQRVALQYHLNKIHPILHKLLNHFVLSKVRQKIGLDRVKLCVVGAAPTKLETFEFFCGIGLPIIESYGMTELSSSATLPKNLKFGSAGKCLSGLEIKILDPDDEGCGEVCFRGRSTFMGYLNEMERTKKCVDDDRWLHTGDLGFVDSEGFLYITGRIKELLITAGGENIPFLHIENLVKSECPAISNAFLIGDQRKFLSILITFKLELDSQNVPTDILALDSLKFMNGIGLNFRKLSQVQNHPKVSEAIQNVIDRVNKKAISNAQKIQKFSILSNDFSITSGELSPTLKVKRSFVCQKYAEVIECLYQDSYKGQLTKIEKEK